MEQMELFNFYNLDECIDKKKLVRKLKQFENEGKIEYSIDGELLKIEDLDLSEEEVQIIANLFDSLDVFPCHDREDDEDFYEGYDNFDDEEEDEW